jgi:hypothetical protein
MRQKLVENVGVDFVGRGDGICGGNHVEEFCISLLKL